MPTQDTVRTRERLLMLLKMRGPQTAQQLATKLDITAMAVRQHLYALQQASEVTFEDHGGKVGRPARHWRLTDQSRDRFPDTHAELSVQLIESIRATLGDEALRQLIRHQQQRTQQRYQQQLRGVRRLGDRVRVLARLRDEEGYMATAERQRDGSYLLTENHCPICAAASACQGFCEAEVDLLANSLGGDAKIVREAHLLSGANRCTYRIESK